MIALMIVGIAAFIVSAVIAVFELGILIGKKESLPINWIEYRGDKINEQQSRQNKT